LLSRVALSVGVHWTGTRERAVQADEIRNSAASGDNLLRDEGQPAGSEGIHAKNAKLRPPLVFRREHGDHAVLAFERSLSAL
jgi:hypothetical protein